MIGCEEIDWVRRFLADFVGWAVAHKGERIDFVDFVRLGGLGVLKRCLLGLSCFLGVGAWGQGRPVALIDWLSVPTVSYSALLPSAAAPAAPMIPSGFSAGNLVVEQVGDGTSYASGVAAPV